MLAINPASTAKSPLVWISGVAAGLWGGLSPLVQTLVVLIGLDFASGMILAWTTKSVSSDASYRGMGKKAMMLILVGAAHTFNATQPLGFDAASAVAGFFCATELISIVENGGRLGLPIPPVLMQAIEKLKGAPTNANN